MLYHLRYLIFLLPLLAMAGVAPGADRLTDDENSRLYTVPHNPEMQQAVENSDLKMLVVLHEGWQETLPSFARLKIYEITGRTSIKGQLPAYTVLSMIYEPAKWDTARVLPVEHPDLLEMLSLDGKWVSPIQVRESPGLNGLVEYLQAAGRRQAELRRTRKLLNAVEQANRLGREERVLTQHEFDPNDPISRSEIVELLDNPSELRALHEQRAELEKETDEHKALVNAGNRILSRTMALAEIRNDFLVVPDAESVPEQWVRPVALESGTMTLGAAGRAFDRALAEAFRTENPELLRRASEEFLSIVSRSRLYPSETWREMLNLYITQNPWRTAAWLYLLAGCVFGLYFFFGTRKFYWTAVIITLAGFLFNTAAVGLRLYLKGHVPVSNMFEAITFCAWAVMLIAIFFEGYQRRALVGLGANVIAFLFLIGASLMPLHETRLHPLRAVLNSYWLNIHVTMMLLSYAAFALAFVFAIVHLVRTLSAKDARLIGVGGGVFGFGLLGLYYLMHQFETALYTSSKLVNMVTSSLEIGFFLLGSFLLIGAGIAIIGFGIIWGMQRLGLLNGEPAMTLEQNEAFAYRLVQVGWPILTLGVTLGAVWADTAWGRFWGWDPKETWAFITWVTYTVYLHMRMVMGWRGRMSSAACVIGFIMVLITWLGVSYLPWFSGGLHSYASPT